MKLLNVIDNLFEKEHYRRMLLTGLVILAVAMRLGFALSIEHPGHGDMSYYLTLAENLTDGRGFVIDYIWHFFYPEENLTHPANDFWMPLTSVLISLFLLIFGKSILAALIPSIIFAVFIAWLAYEISLIYLKSKPMAFVTAAICLFTPHFFSYSLQTDSTIYYAGFVSLGLYFVFKARQQGKYVYLAALLAGLAHLTRQDGVLFLVTLLICISLLQISITRKLKYLVLGLIIYLAMLLPLMLSNLHYFGSLFASGSYKSAFLKTYEDFYSYSKELNLSSYLSLGFNEIAKFKLLMLFVNVKTTLKLFGNFLFPLMVLAIATMFYRFIKSGIKSLAFPPLLFLSILYLFYSLIASYAAYHGAYYRSVQALTPFFVIFAIDGLTRLVKARAISYPLLGIIILSVAYLSIIEGNRMVNNSARLNMALTGLKDTIELLHDSNDEIIIMTRAPWEVNYTTGYRAVQIPHEDLDTIYSVARKYKANYLVLPAPNQELEGVYSGAKKYPAFNYLADIPGTDMKLYKIE